MIHIQLAPEIEAQLAAEAQSHGLALEHYIAEKLSAVVNTHDAGERSIDEAIRTIRTLRKGNRLSGLSLQELIREGRRH